MVAKSFGSMPSLESNSSPAASGVRRLLLNARYKPLVKVERLLLPQRRKQRLREEQGLDPNPLALCILLDFFQSLGKLKSLSELDSGRACGFRKSSGQPF